MSWFGLNPKNKAIDVESNTQALEYQKMQQVEVAKKAQKVQWMSSQPTSDFVELFQVFETQLKSVTQKSSKLSDENKVSYRRALDCFAQVRKTFFEIDRHLLREDQALCMYELISDNLPQSISRFQEVSISENISTAWIYASGIKQQFATFFKTLATIRDSQIGLIPDNLIAKKEVDNSEFPQYGIADATIADSLTRIRKLWKQASEKNNTVENEYFLEQVVSSYLPEAYRLYSTFQLAPEELQKSAAKIFIEQLELIERHLVHILRTYMEQNLVAMQNHMDFLKQKTLDSAEKPELLEIAAT